MIHTFYVILGVIFALFLAQNFRTKVLTAQKNLLLECLLRHPLAYMENISLTAYCAWKWNFVLRTAILFLNNFVRRVKILNIFLCRSYFRHPKAYLSAILNNLSLFRVFKWFPPLSYSQKQQFKSLKTFVLSISMLP